MDPKKTQPVPEFSPEEMKMPEEEFRPAPVQHSWLIPALIAIIVILLLIAAGLYIWLTMLPTPPLSEPEDALTPEPTPVEEPAATTTATTTDEFETASTSDEIDAIEADINNTDLEEMDAELNAIDAELEASSSAN